MSVNFKESKTKENLMRAFAGESQARNRYTFAASQAKKEQLHVIESIFMFTANQEKEHAEVFYKFLEEAAKENIHVDGSYPVDITNSVVELLKMAEHNENEEHDIAYKDFGDIALEEGFTKIGTVFHQIAAIEKTHAERFGYFARLLEEGKLFVSDVEVDWMCLNCGHVYNGKKAPKKCPVCDHNQGYFIRLKMTPYYPHQD